MKASEAKRASMLVEALETINDVAQALDGDETNQFGEKLGLEISAGYWSEAGGSTEEYLLIDPITGRCLLPLLRDLIERELRSLGVDP